MPEGEVFVVNAYTKQSVALGPGVKPDWSPVDDIIILQRFDEISTVKTDGSGLQKIAETSGDLIGWSPDGSRFAWWKGSLGKGVSVYIKEADRDSIQVIELDDTRIGIGSWEPSGIVVYSNSGWGQRESELTYVSILDVETGPAVLIDGLRLCTEGTSDWTSDGRPACSWWGYMAGDYTGWINAVTFYGKTITVVEGLLRPSHPSWSPDGRRLAFDLELPDSTNEIFIAEGEGLEEIRQITFDGQGNYHPEWSPDGDVIVYQTDSSLAFISPETPSNVGLISWGEVKRKGE